MKTFISKNEIEKYIYIISFEPISKILMSNSIHELTMTSVISAFLRETTIELYRIV